MYLVSVLVPIPPADALVSLLTAPEEFSPSPALILGIPVPVGKVWGEAQLCGALLKAAAVGFFQKQILLFVHEECRAQSSRGAEPEVSKMLDSNVANKSVVCLVCNKSAGK